MSKVFCIGFHKTGTTTFAECCKILGYSVCPETDSYTYREIIAALKYHAILPLINLYDVFEDSPWNYKEFYKYLYMYYLDAYFVWTYRDPVTWATSLLRWSFRNNYQDDLSYFSTFGCRAIEENRELMVQSYIDYHYEVLRYFRTKSRFLAVNWEAGHGWKELCAFLDKPIPNAPFPHRLRYNPITDTYDD